MKKQVYTSIIISLVLLLSASRPIKAVVSGGTPVPVAMGPGPVLPSGSPTEDSSSQATSQPLLGGMNYNDVTDKFSVDLASLNNTMAASHKVLGVQIFSLQDNPMTGYIAVDGKKVANYTLENAVPQDANSVALGQLNNYYLVVSASDFAQLYQAKLAAMAGILKNGVKQDWQQKMQQAKTKIGSKIGSFLKDVATKLEQATNKNQ